MDHQRKSPGVAHKREKKNSYRILDEKPEGKMLLGSPRRR
jgi:hypothetical protein